MRCNGPIIALALASLCLGGASPANKTPVLTGRAAFGDWHTDAPGIRRRIDAADLPPAYATSSASNTPSVLTAIPGATPKAPPGFVVQRYAEGLENPRLLRVAPNGDIFVAETAAGRIRVLRGPDGAPRPERREIFAAGMDLPFGIAFWPPGPDPHWVYVATLNTVLRFAYHQGDLRATARPEIIVPRLTDAAGGHITRDIQFTPDGRRMLVSVGSASNAAQSMPHLPPDQIRAWEANHGTGAAWGDETNRADVLSFDPDGHNGTMFATGLRNCVGLAIHPQTGDAWCSTNERDGLGDDLPPDYVTRIRPGAFYGWPWTYIGNHEDPRHRGERPDLAGKTTIPDILLQPHSAPLQMTFYPLAQTGPAAFPADFAGDGFVALHGSWNRTKRTGYKIMRLRLNDGIPTGETEDFLTGFVLGDDAVWARPVGVAVAHDGALLLTEDGNNTIWRVAPARR